MRVLRRYIRRQVLSSIVLVLAGLLMLFSFFDLIYEMRDLGATNTRLTTVLAFVALSMPGRLYELFPIAALIGTLFALAQMVVSSEFAVMRTSGVSIVGIGSGLLQVGLALSLTAFVVGEFITPLSEEAAQRMRLQETSSVVASSFRSGLWVKDESSFVNVGRVLHDATLEDIRIYRFDGEYRLLTISQAHRGTYMRDNLWRLEDIVLTRFEPDRTSVERIPEMEWRSVLTPRILSVLLVPPEKMSLFTLFSYVQHLRNNNQESGRYEIALWNKIIYPIAILVMMVVALPFSYLNVREGGISTKIFAGIMLGLLFHVLTRLIGHVGQLAAWPPLLAAVAPTVVFILLGVGMIRRLERR
jgi:lipopolysaccharide export system permease protein